MKWLQAAQWADELIGLGQAWAGQGLAAERQAEAMQAVVEWLG